MIVDPDPWGAPITAEQWAQLRERWPNGTRLAAAWRLARDVDACAALLRGDPVDRDRLDPDGFAYATTQRLVRLERPADLFDVREAA